MATSALRNALIARASDGTSTAGAPPKGLSPPTLALRTYSGFALVILAIEVQPRKAIDAAPSAIIARVLKHIIAKKDSRESLSICGSHHALRSYTRGVPRRYTSLRTFAHPLHYKKSA